MPSIYELLWFQFNAPLREFRKERDMGEKYMVLALHRYVRNPTDKVQSR
jgi:hypothetical protein